MKLALIYSCLFILIEEIGIFFLPNAWWAIIVKILLFLSFIPQIKNAFDNPIYTKYKITGWFFLMNLIYFAVILFTLGHPNILQAIMVVLIVVNFTNMFRVIDRTDKRKSPISDEEIKHLLHNVTPPALKNLTDFTWYEYGSGRFRINLSDKRYILIVSETREIWKAFYHAYDKYNKQTHNIQITDAGKLDQVVRSADDYILDKFNELLPVVSLKATWRSEPITDKQKEFLYHSGVSQEMISTLNKGQASYLITKITEMN